MIKYLKHSQIDKNRWDNCINNAVNGNIYGYSWYLDIICESWDALVNEDYSAVLPVTRGRKYMMDYIYPPFFAQQLGLYTTHKINDTVCEKFLNAIPSPYRFVEMNLNSSMTFVPSSFTSTKKMNLVLQLNKSYEEVKSGFSDHHRRNISKSYKNDLKLNKHEDAKTVVELFRANKGRIISNLKTIHYDQLLELIKTAANHNMVRVWSVNKESDSPCAAAIFFESHSSSVFIFSATNNDARKYAAMYFLLDQYFHEFSKLLKYFDFEGSNNPDLARFYKGFGSEELVYLQIKRNQLPPPWSWFKN